MKVDAVHVDKNEKHTHGENSSITVRCDVLCTVV